MLYFLLQLQFLENSIKKQITEKIYVAFLKWKTQYYLVCQRSPAQNADSGPIFIILWVERYCTFTYIL